MTKDNLITTTEVTDFERAADILQEHKIEKLPVIDGNNKLVGLITYRDIIKIKTSLNKDLIPAIESRSHLIPKVIMYLKGT